VLTEEGRTVQVRLGRAHARHVATAMTRTLTPAQLRALRDLSHALVAEDPAASSPERPAL
jgi:hypothetical protein